MLATYDLHDSIVESVEYLLDEKKVLIKLELCQWKQANYDESEPEMQEGVLTFTNVNSFQIEPSSFLINSNEILNVNVDNEARNIEIILTGTDDIGKVSIIAQDIFWEGC
ncbi:hypothetical protein MH117_01965 [Paenibacillus sp. ACRRX]|uniref:hypothetical protein n=1 Tax=Paenibacillus sp. ACRRX TaxID=2918206 RepID=UPI001EF5C204|nr:hypothetical protein [Paenibacillus sp. ACRRX]MCG7406165.1 hypothetical protein [Paenibacillus sp. ACRRX]